MFLVKMPERSPVSGMLQAMTFCTVILEFPVKYVFFGDRGFQPLLYCNGILYRSNFRPLETRSKMQGSLVNLVQFLKKCIFTFECIHVLIDQALDCNQVLW